MTAAGMRLEGSPVSEHGEYLHVHSPCSDILAVGMCYVIMIGQQQACALHFSTCPSLNSMSSASGASNTIPGLWDTWLDIRHVVSGARGHQGQQLKGRTLISVSGNHAGSDTGCVGLCPGDLTLSLTLSPPSDAIPQMRCQWKKTPIPGEGRHWPDLARLLANDLVT